MESIESTHLSHSEDLRKNRFTPECPICQSKSVVPVRKVWKFGYYSVTRYNCTSCEGSFNFYAAQNGSTYTIPRKISEAERKHLVARKHAVYLRKDFREVLFCKCYERAGSLHSLARSIKYKTSAGREAKDMWVGVKAVPSNILEALSSLSGIPLNAIVKNLVPRSQNELSEDWVYVYNNYKKPKSVGRKSRV